MLRDQTTISVDEGAKILAAADKDMAPAIAKRREQSFLSGHARAGTLGLEWHPEFRSSAGGGQLNNG
ncbi:hypothetical protein [Mesorhizobium sp.]|uniref:hypothetical protein n=1 Tax=Mesorhizobium sp. TaxID=1871066 RepID=UPI000FEA18E5|nr:hypothetical protein [Mesorhizobium sp.]RWM29780.1 MAG: hypothetical protein EOR75_31880 [Mesorhizobium sp.]TJV47678.1 MAG: hypothetical protein E5Y01_31735 [Mesorhizobium sp.]